MPGQPNHHAAKPAHYSAKPAHYAAAAPKQAGVSLSVLQFTRIQALYVKDSG